MAQYHELETWAPYWDAISRGEKNFELRRDDRGFQKGDTLVLIRMKQSTSASGPSWIEDRDYNNGQRTLSRKITYILTGGQFGLEPGYVVMGLKK